MFIPYILVNIYVKYISLLFTRKTFLHEYIYHDSFPPTHEN